MDDVIFSCNGPVAHHVVK